MTAHRLPWPQHRSKRIVNGGLAFLECGGWTPLWMIGCCFSAVAPEPKIQTSKAVSSHRTPGSRQSKIGDSSPANKAPGRHYQISSRNAISQGRILNRHAVPRCSLVRVPFRLTLDLPAAGVETKGGSAMMLAIIGMAGGQSVPVPLGLVHFLPSVRRMPTFFSRSTPSRLCATNRKCCGPASR